MSIRKLIGDRIYLSPIDMRDVEQYVIWLNDPEVALNMQPIPREFNRLNEEEFLRQLASAGQVAFGIRLLEDDRLIGNIGFNAVDHANQVATLGLFIGEREFRSRGYGREAIQLMLDYAFLVLNIHNVNLCVFSFNQRGIRCYEACGFREVGRRRESKLLGGKRYDQVTMDILSHEYKPRFLGAIVDQVRGEVQTLLHRK